MPSGGGQQSRRVSGSSSKGLSVASGERKLNRIRMGSTARASLEMLFVRGSKLMSCIQGCILVSDKRYDLLRERQDESVARDHRKRIGLDHQVATENLGVWVAMMRTPQVVPHCLQSGEPCGFATCRRSSRG